MKKRKSTSFLRNKFKVLRVVSCAIFVIGVICGDPYMLMDGSGTEIISMAYRLMSRAASLLRSKVRLSSSRPAACAPDDLTDKGRGENGSPSGKS